MRERLERTLGRTARAIWILTFHAACGRILRREAERLGYRSTFTIYDQADQVRVVKACLEELGKDPKRFTPRGIHSQISNAKNQLISPEEYASRVASFWDQTVAEVYELLPAAAVRLERGRLRRHAHADRAGPRALPGGARALADDVPSRPRRRVPGHEPRPVPPPAAPGGEAPERVRRRRPRPVDLRVPGRGHPEHPRLRAGLRRCGGHRARAELPLDELDPRGGQRGDRQQPRPEAQAALVGPRPGRPRRGGRGRGRARGGAIRRRRDRATGRGRELRLGDRRLLPDERPVARAGGRARAAGRPVPGDRRPAVLRACRDQGCGRLPRGAEQLDGRGLADAHRKPAAARDRRHLDPAPGRARGRARHLALGGDRRPGGGGRGGGERAGAPLVPDDDGVADVGRAGARGRRARAGGARAVGDDRGVRGGADDRGARPDREPRGARRLRAGVPRARRGAGARRASWRRCSSSPTRTRSPPTPPRSP